MEKQKSKSKSKSAKSKIDDPELGVPLNTSEAAGNEELGDAGDMEATTSIVINDGEIIEVHSKAPAAGGVSHAIVAADDMNGAGLENGDHGVSEVAGFPGMKHVRAPSALEQKQIEENLEKSFKKNLGSKMCPPFVAANITLFIFDFVITVANFWTAIYPAFDSYFSTDVTHTACWEFE